MGIWKGVLEGGGSWLEPLGTECVGDKWQKMQPCKMVDKEGLKFFFGGGGG